MDFFKKSPVCILMDLLKNRQDRVVENDRFISWTNENAGNQQGSIFELLLFLIYISDLLNGLHYNLKLFADCTSLFSALLDLTTTTVCISYNILKMHELAVQWKHELSSWSLKTSSREFSREKISSRRISSELQPLLCFSDNQVLPSSHQKTLTFNCKSWINFWWTNSTHLKKYIR